MKNQRLRWWHKLNLYLFRWVVICLSLSLAYSYLRTSPTVKTQTGSKAKSLPTAIDTNFDQQELQSILRFESMVYNKDIVGVMHVLDSYNSTYIEAAAYYNLDPVWLKAHDVIESGGYIYALSIADCAGIAQFSVRTARASGLKVGPNWRKYYRAFVNASAKDKPKYGAILARYDERFDPRKAIWAQARHLRDLLNGTKRVDLAIWSYHAGSPRVFQAVNLYVSCPDKPKFTGVSHMISDTDRRHRPALHTLLHVTLQDHSVDYYHKVMAAYFCVSYWEYDRKGFSARVDFYRNPVFRGKLYIANTVPQVHYVELVRAPTWPQVFGETLFNLWFLGTTFVMNFILSIFGWIAAFGRRYR